MTKRLRSVKLGSVEFNGVEPPMHLTVVADVDEDGALSIRHIESDSIARDLRCKFVPIRHVSKHRQRIFELEDETDQLRELCADLYAEMITYSDAPNYNASVWAPKLRELGIEVDK